MELQQQRTDVQLRPRAKHAWVSHVRERIGMIIAARKARSSDMHRMSVAIARTA